MEDEAIIRKWEDLDIDVLVKIYQKIDIFDLTSGVADICKTWHHAARDPMLWRTLDLSVLSSNYIRTPLEPYVYVDGPSDEQLTKILKISLNLSRGSIKTLIFNINLYVHDEQLTYTAERCPNLKRLVLPAWNRIKKTGICKAIKMWKDLESLTMPSIETPLYFMEKVSKNCKNFSELKIMGPCDIFLVNTLIRCVPNLKVLSLRCSVVYLDALILILDGLKNLNVLNISHCVIVDAPPPDATIKVVTKLDDSVLKKGSRLSEFLTCMDDECIMCQRTRADEGLLRWYRYEEGLWKQDEVKSLAV
ncbi:putative F-box domain, leucine-rich repeat domain superfamily, F-box-like domain superfamily [Helianthus annuus]|uniref:F-box domain, leucine-rich repeat domain superfamily, F-box-like domain superfamily n=1 Tax=Helianthus annuus TaxID=4232 RepID=A0A251UEC6_HELAN|nr:F-box/LRR-repeat protein At3g48880 [Helianthus annuus]KAF5800490.1 putative F-box domain, leucine-rich repeat domain superfamily, F-box-like domain superfamily [Helianthus annuus]